MALTTSRYIAWGVVWALLLPLGVAAADAPASGPAEQAKLRHKTDPAAVAEVAAGRRKVASAAWWGYHEQDATACLQDAIRSGVPRLVVPNMGKPWVIRPVLLESDQEIVFEKGTVIMAKAGEFRGRGDSLLRARNKVNITLRGPGASLVMRKKDYQQPPYEEAEWRHCLSLCGCRNVKVEGLRLVASGGDGIYIGRGDADHPHGKDITIRNVTCEDHHRQGISVITAENLLIEGCTLRGTQGTAPQAGIDYEPNKADERLTDCVLRDCTIDHNAGYGILLYLGPLRAETQPISITIERCKVRDNRRGSLAIAGAKHAGGVRGVVRLEGNTFEGKQDIDTWPHLKIEAHD